MMAVVIGDVAFCGLHSTALAHEARTLHFVAAVKWPVFHERASVKSALVEHRHRAFHMIRTEPFKDTGFFFPENIRLLHRYDAQGTRCKHSHSVFLCSLAHGTPAQDREPILAGRRSLFSALTPPFWQNRGVGTCPMCGSLLFSDTMFSKKKKPTVTDDESANVTPP